MPGGRKNPLFGLYDRDPGPWRPMHYGVKISVGVNAGQTGRGSISLNNQPFILSRITHKIVGLTATPSASGLYNDGQYDMEFKDEQSVYQKGDIPADLMFGNYGSADAGNGGGFLMNMPYPLPYPGNKTLSFVITNAVDRTLDPVASDFVVAICASGIMYWGELKFDMNSREYR